MNEEWNESIDEKSKKKKEKFYSSTKRKIRKYIPKEKELSHITILDDKKKRESKIDTIDIKKQIIYVSGISSEYNRLYNKLEKDKEELRLLKRQLPGHIENIEYVPKRIDELKKVVTARKNLLREEEKTPGFLKWKFTEFLEKIRRKMEEDNLPEELRKEIEKDIIWIFDLKNLKKSIEDLESEIEFQLNSQDNSKDIKIKSSYEIEELEKLIQELEPIVRKLKDKLDEETKKLKAERTSNLMKLFDKGER